MNDNDIKVNDNKTTRENVREILEQLVTHFGQNIHTEVIVNSYSKDVGASISVFSSSTNVEDDEQLPQEERSTPPILQFWLDRLVSGALQMNGPVETTDRVACDAKTSRPNNDQSCSQNDDGIISVLCQWICGYEEFVRPRMFRSSSVSFASNSMPTFDERCVPLLKSYELLLSKLLSKFNAIEKDDKYTSTLVPTIPLSYSIDNLLRIINLLATDVTLLTVSTSETHRGDSDESKNEKNNYFRRNEGLPTLLQILGNTLETLRQTISNSSTNSDNDQRNNRSNRVVPECYGPLRRCAVTLLAFDVLGDTDTDCSFTDFAESSSAVFLPHTLSPSLSRSTECRNEDLFFVRLMLMQLEMSTSCSASASANARKCLDGALRVNSLSYDDVDDEYWNSLLPLSQGSLSTEGWIDSNPNNARRTLRLVQGVWRVMASVLALLSKEEGQVHGQSYQCEEEGWKARVDDIEQYRKRRSFVLKMLGGPVPLLRDVRAHFFGRNLHGMKDLTQQNSKLDGNDTQLSSVKIKMGRRIIETKKNTDAGRSPFDGSINERVPSITAAAVNALRLLLVPAMIDDISRSCKESVLQDVFPMCAALLDSKNASFGSLGAAGFLRVIDVLAPGGAVPERHTLQENDILDGTAWGNFVENTLTVLERSLQSSSGHGHVIVAIGRAQSRLFETVLSRGKQNGDEERNNDNRFRKRRRTVTEQWLMTLERSLYRPATTRQQLELLLGGVIPLLSQHARDENSEADAMELGRLGLSALLPLTRSIDTSEQITEQVGVDVGKKIQMASMVALINLIFAAHPIMASHGGKITSHLLVAAASAKPSTRNIIERESKGANIEGSLPTADSTRDIAVLIAAIVLGICKSKFAAQLLESIEKNHGQYEQNLLSAVSEVREVAAGLTALS